MKRIMLLWTVTFFVAYPVNTLAVNGPLSCSKEPNSLSTFTVISPKMVAVKTVNKFAKFVCYVMDRCIRRKGVDICFAGANGISSAISGKPCIDIEKHANGVERIKLGTEILCEVHNV